MTAREDYPFEDRGQSQWIVMCQEIDRLREERDASRADWCCEPHTTGAERRVLDAVANWRPKPGSSGALMRLMQEAEAWLADPEART